MQTNPGPLAGIRVLDLSMVFAMPYAGGLLGDLGAEVIKIEGPGRLDQTRGFGALPENEPGEDSWNRTGTFASLNRNKRSFVLDLTQQRARDLFLKLAAQSDVVIENFTPRVMRGWGLDYEGLKAVKRDIIMMSNTGYGSTGPWSQYPSQGTVLEATIGISAYTGYPGGDPSRAGQSYPDFLATWTGLNSLLAALHYRDRSGKGQWIDLGMYQIGASLVPEALLAHQLTGSSPQRTGNQHQEHVPYNLYAAAGRDEWIAVCVMSDSEWRLLAEIMDRPDLAQDARFATAQSRREHRNTIDSLVGAWTVQQEARAVAKTLQEAGIAAGAVLNARDLLSDPHLTQRRFFEFVPHSDDIGPRPLIGRPYKITAANVGIRRAAPKFGADNVYVLRDLLGLGEDEVQDLYASGIVSDRPQAPRRVAPLNIAAGIEAGTVREVDEEYRQRLGLEAPRKRELAD